MKDLGVLSFGDHLSTQADLIKNQTDKLHDLQNQIAKETIKNDELKESCSFYEKAIYLMLVLMLATAAINHQGGWKHNFSFVQDFIKNWKYIWIENF